jgi:hypothetical protein
MLKLHIDGAIPELFSATPAAPLQKADVNKQKLLEQYIWFIASLHIRRAVN